MGKRKPREKERRGMTTKWGTEIKKKRTAR